MFQNYFRVALRNLWRNRVHTLINLLGLSLGLASCLLVTLYVQDELTYDAIHEHREEVFRVSTLMTQNGETSHYALSSLAVGQGLAEQYPEIRAAACVRLQLEPVTVQVGDRLFSEEQVYQVDPSLTEVFTFDFVEGNANAAIRPQSVAISTALRDKYFGSDPAVGEFLRIDGQDFEVSAVFRDLPGNTDLPIRAMTSLGNLSDQARQVLLWDWGRIGFYTYLRFDDRASALAFAPKLDEFAEAGPIPFWQENGINGEIRYQLDALPDLHFVQGQEYDTVKGNLDYLYIFSLAGLFLLLIACINYINLAIAQAANRSVEVGIRKAAGAAQGHLVRQFLGESLIMASIALVLAIVWVELALPGVNMLAGKDFAFGDVFQPLLGLAMLGLVLLIGLLAGSYPAWYLAAIRPSEVLKGQWRLSGNQWLRKVLVVGQFTISLALIIATLVVFEQLRFMKNQDLGFQSEQILVVKVPAGDTTSMNKLPAFQATLRSLPAIRRMATSGRQVPGDNTGRLLFRVERDGQLQEDHFNVISVDEAYRELLDIGLLAGRDFERSRQTDAGQAFIVNQALVDYMGWPDPIGKRMQWGLEANDQAAYDGKVVGVIEDYHYASLHNVVQPLVWLYNPNNPGRLFLEIKGGQIPETMAALQLAWREFDQHHPLEAFFLDEFFNRQYQNEERLMTIFSWFSVLTIVIACMGLFGLASFITQQRKHEIGIRKVLGAESGQILALLSREFLLLVLVALSFAVVIGWRVMGGWLDGFALRTPMPWYTFVAAGIGALLIAFLTTSYHALRAAHSRPVQAMRPG